MPVVISLRQALAPIRNVTRQSRLWLTRYYLMAASNPKVKMKPIMIPKEVKCSCPCS
jgi:hypothetical protein